MDVLFRTAFREHLCAVMRFMEERKLNKKTQMRVIAYHNVLWEAYRLVMVALCNRADHYIFILFLSSSSSSSSSFFPRLISVVGYWMFTILRYMVWP